MSKKGQIGADTVIVDDFNMSLSALDRVLKLKATKLQS